MDQTNVEVETARREAEALTRAEQAGTSARLRTYWSLSGPGWLQSAITLGGGSLSGSLYLGIVAGFGMLWVQPLSMMLGIIVLSCIATVTLHMGEQPLKLISRHVNPVLGWGWALAALVASMVWALPQYALSIGVLEQNLLPQLGLAAGPSAVWVRVLMVSVIFLISTRITWAYGRGLRGVRLYEHALKLMVGMIVLCFACVVGRLLTVPGALDFSQLAGGLLPDLSLAFEPAPRFLPLLEAVDPAHRDYWRELLVERQRDVMVASAAGAVGINMTYLLPYSLLRRGWGRAHVGLSRFDLLIGMFTPFALATALVVMVSASQFHALPPTGLPPGGLAEASAQHMAQYNGLLEGLVQRAPGVATSAQGLGLADRQLAATLVTRDAFDLAKALEPLMGSLFSQVVFGLGVLGMTLSTISLEMLICGLVVTEMLGLPPRGWPFRLSSLAGAVGVLGPFVWGKAAFWLAVPTSIFGFTLMPIACLAFLFLINQRSVLGERAPKGRSRVAWNVAMGVAVVVFTPASLIMTYNKGGLWGVGAVGAFVLAVGISHALGGPRTQALREKKPA